MYQYSLSVYVIEILDASEVLEVARLNKNISIAHLACSVLVICFFTGNWKTIFLVY